MSSDAVADVMTHDVCGSIQLFSVLHSDRGVTSIDWPWDCVLSHSYNFIESRYDYSLVVTGQPGMVSVVILLHTHFTTNEGGLSGYVLYATSVLRRKEANNLV